jgi:hypothetical protein
MVGQRIGGQLQFYLADDAGFASGTWEDETPSRRHRLLS